VTLGGRRVAVKRPRVRTADGESEVSLETYEHFGGRDRLGRLALERILAGDLTRKYRRVQQPVGEQATARERSTSKSSVSRAFVQRTREALWHLMSRQLADLRLAVVMLDGILIKGRTNVVALGSRPTVTSSRSACGPAAPRTPRSLARCYPIWSPAARTSSRDCCS